MKYLPLTEKCMRSMHSLFMKNDLVPPFWLRIMLCSLIPRPNFRPGNEAACYAISLLRTKNSEDAQNGFASKNTLVFVFSTQRCSSERQFEDDNTIYTILCFHGSI